MERKKRLVTMISRAGMLTMSCTNSASFRNVCFFHKNLWSCKLYQAIESFLKIGLPLGYAASLAFNYQSLTDKQNFNR